ncbi:hypothetical protein [Pseudomonas syringae]|uniref:hypothetical protein n=1 Tax=Pseudomonas syringae TaxID=317 RepID=UPI001F454803|nr:hypothetical protein [Pseudomonas syringae]MBL3835502.1 hypothetical protein [Pseudomonas syringae pv. theae]GKQ45045.1 hypothetical protein PSTH2693_07835 [Pseudomonas syringae pv. theae]
MQMAWRFRDRYMTGEVITIPSDIIQKLHKLNDTLDAYRWYELLPAKEREKTIGDGGILADILTKHVMCCYYIGWFDIEDDEAFENYKKDFRKFFIDPHPAFAACRFAACLGFIRHQRKLIEKCEFLSVVQEGDSIFTNKKIVIENQNIPWE